MLILKVQFDINKTYCSKRKCLKVRFGMVFSQLKVQFSRSAETLGAAIIAHGTKASDVTYVLSTEYISDIQINLSSCTDCNPFHCSLQL